MARPTIYTDVIGEKICELTATTSMGLERICKQVGVSYSIVRDWKNDKTHPLSAIYARAKDAQLDMIAEEILDISDDGRNDLMTVGFGDKAYEAENKEVVNRSKLRCDNRRWLLSKLKPKVYGDKLELSGDADNPITVKNVSFE